MAAEQAAPISGPQPAPKLKQMLLTDRLRQHIGDCLHSDLLNDEPEYSKVLLPPRSRGRPEDMGKLLTFLNDSQHPDCINRKTTLETLTTWINDLREIGIKENERLIKDSQPGRNSEAEVQPEYIKIWADLMQLHEEGKKEAVKITRYNHIPDHLVGTGVKLLKVDSAFLPDPRSVGAGAGKIDQAEGIKMAMKRKQEALAKQMDEGDESGKTCEHLCTRRVGAGDSGQGRDKFQDALIGLLQVKERKVDTEAARLAMEERKEMSARLDKYMEYLVNPNIPEEIKSNYKSMVLKLQAQLQAAQPLVSPTIISHSPAMTPQFTSPTHSQTRQSSTETQSP